MDPPAAWPPAPLTVRPDDAVVCVQRRLGPADRQALRDAEMNGDGDDTGAGRRGRPRKRTRAEGEGVGRLAGDGDGDGPQAPAGPKRRGRPPKRKAAEEPPVDVPAGLDVEGDDEVEAGGEEEMMDTDSQALGAPQGEGAEAGRPGDSDEDEEGSGGSSEGGDANAGGTCNQQ